MKIVYIKWFFECIWQCIKDLPYQLYFMKEINLIKENWSDFKTRIELDKDPEFKEILNKINKQNDEE